MTGSADRLSAALADRYRIERELGAGGMATVYLAQDLKHDRKVAIKVLKPELAAVLGAERFVVEIKTTAAMSHPHILPLFDSGTADGFLFYVMPYIQGETIREKLNRETQFGVDEAVRIAREVADALDYAHRHGVIHRDIKPENILLHDGRAMVMDFGIALAVSAAAGGRMTETGLSLGTPHYMSPEQATAEKEITGRSDQYSLASVLYEMLSGQPPHNGGAAQQVIMKIITDTARPVHELRRNVPPNVDAALAKALEKLPADRFETARAFAEALQSSTYVGTRTGIQAPPLHTRRERVARFAPWVVAGTAMVAAIAIAMRPPKRPREVLRLETAPPVGSVFAERDFASVSPDGRRIAFAAIGPTGRRLLWIRDLATGREDSLPATAGAQAPFWSPDGTSLGYFARGALIRIEANGNAPRLLCPTPDLHGSWSTSGVIIFTVLARPYTVSATSGKCVPVGGYWADSTNRIQGVEWLPDGRHFAGMLNRAIVVSDDAGSRPTTLVPVGSSVRFVAPDIAVYSVPGSTGADLSAQRFDPGTFSLRGSATLLAQGIRTGGAIPSYAVGANIVAYLHDRSSQGAGLALQVVDPRGAVVDTFSVPNVWTFRRARSRPLVAAGGRRLWLYDLTRRTLSALDGPRSIWPVWSPGDSLLAVVSPESTTTIDSGVALCTNSVNIIPLSDPSRRTRISPPEGMCVRVVSDWTSDGRKLVLTAPPGDAPHRSAIVTYDLATARFEKIHESRSGALTHGVVSPDQRWLAYVSDETGEHEVYVRPFQTGGTSVRVSTAGGAQPRWSGDGRWLYFVTPDEVISRIAVTPGVREVFGLPEHVLRGPAGALVRFADQADGLLATTQFDVSDDGQRLFVRTARQVWAVTVVSGWQALMTTGERSP